ncbi:MAG: ceramidase domain-containing protein [Gammaproteobacteria bacterium]
MKKLGVIVGIAVAAVLAAVLAPPVPQDLSYHVFADRREMLGVPNFWNVSSNLPFLFVGLAGLMVAGKRTDAGMIPALRTGYLVFFTGVALVAAGSGYYHLNPSNESLVWDRLPMTFSFMAFFAVIIGENISVRSGVRLLWPLVALGVMSVVYWHFSELQGRGDLRPYALVQFLPMLLIPVILLLYRSPFTSRGWIWTALCAYGASKLTEFADQPIYEALGLGGHALKHLLAAAGALAILYALLRRAPVREGS